MDAKVIRDALLENNMVAAVVKINKNQYCDISYEYLYSCEFIVDTKRIPVYIGIPINWEQELFDIYIENYKEFPYIPHVDIKGKLCLFDLEGVLIDNDFVGLLYQCIDRAVLIISDGLNRKNQIDFIQEFDAYWEQLKEHQIIKCVIPNEKKSQKIKFVDSISNHKKSDNNINNIKRFKNSVAFAAPDMDSFSTWQIKGTRQNGVYFYLEPNEYIYPPDPRNKIKLEYFNNLLKFCIADKDLKIKTKNMRNTVFIFEIKQPNGDRVCIGVLLKNVILDLKDGVYQINNVKKIEMYPLIVTRLDKKHLMSRTSDVYCLNKKKILLIGCGSIGSYLANELIRAGFEDITFIDNDILKEENIFRHLLGAEYVGMYKAEALVKYFKKNIPCLKLNSICESMQALISEHEVILKDYDMIISATGNHNINRFLNKEIYGKGINIPVVYAWNEPLDIGCHAAVIQYKYKGCYECFLDRTSTTDELFDATAYCEREQKIIKKIAGCSSSFIPYGSTVSLKSALLCMDLINKLLDNRCYCNVLVSLKGDGYYFKKLGFNVTETYKRQTENLDISDIGEKFSKRCEICKQICNYKKQR